MRRVAPHLILGDTMKIILNNIKIPIKHSDERIINFASETFKKQIYKLAMYFWLFFVYLNLFQM